MRLRLFLSLILALGLTVVPVGAVLAQPTNDDLADAAPVVALPFTDSVDASDATLEDGEPDFTCAPLHATVWYAVTLQRNTTVTVDTAGSDYDTVLSVYRGTNFDDFDLVACNDDFTDLQARVTFSASAGETVYVQVGAFGEEEFGPEAGQLEISFTRATKRPTIFKSSFRGSLAFAEWFSEDADAFSETFVALSDGRTKFGPGRPISDSNLSVFHFTEEFDEVTNTVTTTDLFGSTTLSPSQFGIDRRLRNAFVDTDMTLDGFRCVFTVDNGEDFPDDNGEECESFTAEVTVSVTWLGQGGMVRSRFMEREHGDDFRFSFRSRSSSRDATATGVISGDLDLVDGPADFAVIARTADAFMVWTRNGSVPFF